MKYGRFGLALVFCLAVIPLYAADTDDREVTMSVIEDQDEAAEREFVQDIELPGPARDPGRGEEVAEQAREDNDRGNEVAGEARQQGREGERGRSDEARDGDPGEGMQPDDPGGGMQPDNPGGGIQPVDPGGLLPPTGGGPSG